MGTFKIEGGHQLKGSITPQGAKNEALQILCAVLLTPETVTIHNIPDIVDVNKLIKLLSNLGVEVEKLGANSYSFKAENIDFIIFIIVVDQPVIGFPNILVQPQSKASTGDAVQNTCPHTGVIIS